MVVFQGVEVDGADAGTRLAPRQRGVARIISINGCFSTPSHRPMKRCVTGSSKMWQSRIRLASNVPHHALQRTLEACADLHSGKGSLRYGGWHPNLLFTWFAAHISRQGSWYRNAYAHIDRSCTSKQNQHIYIYISLYIYICPAGLSLYTYTKTYTHISAYHAWHCGLRAIQLIRIHVIRILGALFSEKKQKKRPKATKSRSKRF